MNDVSVRQIPMKIRTVYVPFTGAMFMANKFFFPSKAQASVNIFGAMWVRNRSNILLPLWAFLTSGVISDTSHETPYHMMDRILQTDFMWQIQLMSEASTNR